MGPGLTHQLQDHQVLQPETLGPDSAHQQANISPTTLQPCSLSCQDPASPTSRPAPAPEPPGPWPCPQQAYTRAPHPACPGSVPTHQQAVTSLGTHQILQPAMSATSPTDDQTTTRSRTPGPATTHHRPGSTHQWASTRPGTPWVSCLLTESSPPAATAPAQSRAWQPTGQGASHTCQTTHSINLPQQEDPCSPHRGHP
ncbi:predicted GPI-anchored protein 58 [Camelus ferus]|uniref:Predicted GPI-anchored protein 58 n=1 Tax=Camelus ferus TaxID=419612 RepID=A0A8B7KDF5_CAMFR|nr:predicted GPI-anchored protein 58 [Camelus ferus]XP_031297498.1 predicted GPI-anchored protein 58 [Camelus dromedarius]